MSVHIGDEDSEKIGFVLDYREATIVPCGHLNRIDEHYTETDEVKCKVCKQRGFIVNASKHMKLVVKPKFNPETQAKKRTREFLKKQKKNNKK